MKQTEPTSCDSSVVFIGRNGRGNWVAQEKSGLYGGLFINRAEAVRYALFENGHHPEAIVAIPNVIELNMEHTQPSHHPALTDDESQDSPFVQRRVA